MFGGNQGRSLGARATPFFSMGLRPHARQWIATVREPGKLCYADPMPTEMSYRKGFTKLKCDAIAVAA